MFQNNARSGFPFPKTRKIVFLENKPATLPGWVELFVEQVANLSTRQTARATAAFHP
jgi:hypothetical protein